MDNRAQDYCPACEVCPQSQKSWQTDSPNNPIVHPGLTWYDLFQNLKKEGWIKILFSHYNMTTANGLEKWGPIVAATLLAWSCFPNVASFCHTHNFCGGHKNVSENLQKHFSCLCSTQQCCHILPLMGNLVGHNVASLCQGLSFWAGNTCEVGHFSGGLTGCAVDGFSWKKLAVYGCCWISWLGIPEQPWRECDVNVMSKTIISSNLVCSVCIRKVPRLSSAGRWYLPRTDLTLSLTIRSISQTPPHQHCNAHI